jgi:hypothetical protein
LIAKCGLVYRGSPIPQEQLWNGYRALGRHPSFRSDDSPESWSRRIEKGLIPFRPLKLLRRDSWAAGEPPPIATPVNQTERLLATWSRRIQIKCLGVFDTVGTFGVEAVAIPWLQERRAQFHDTELSSAVQNAFHAIALDEHRGNFNCIRWRRAIESDKSAEPESVEPIQQCWFVGAHSNVGGGYDDDSLAQFPLHWMIENCMSLGLRFIQDEPIAPPAIDDCIPLMPQRSSSGGRIAGNVGDSYTQFFAGVWRYVLRNKRNFRRIAPPPEFQNGRAVQSVNETLHPSVEQLVIADQRDYKDRSGYVPPNLWEYWQRKGTAAQKEMLPRPEFTYLQGWRAWTSTLIWLAGSAAQDTWPAILRRARPTARRPTRPESSLPRSL